MPALKGADPQLRPRSLTFSSRSAGGPVSPERSLALWTVAPTAPPYLLSPPPFPRPARRLPQEIPPLPPPSRRIGSGGTVPAAQSDCQSAPAAPPPSAPGPTPIALGRLETLASMRMRAGKCRQLGVGSSYPLRSTRGAGSTWVSRV